MSDPSFAFPGSYLARLTARLAAGVGRQPEDLRRRQAGYLLQAQQADGGFPGRDGASDLYYTSFALRGLALLGALTDDVARPAAGFLEACLERQTPLVDLLSLIYCAALLEITTGTDVLGGCRADWRDRVLAVLERLRRPDGGYARTPEGHVSSTYYTFLVVLARQLLGREIDQPRRLVEFVLAQRRQDGGFVEIRPVKRSGTNPTTAAVALLQIAGGLDAEVRARAVAFLGAMQGQEGGLRANTRIPIADLLSTFTGLWSLVDLGAGDQVDRRSAGRYVRSLEVADGGFRGAAWDDAVDVEYTFYGLGSLALLE